MSMLQRETYRTVPNVEITIMYVLTFGSRAIWIWWMYCHLMRFEALLKVNTIDSHSGKSVKMVGHTNLVNKLKNQ